MTSQQADSEDILQVQDDLFDKNLFAYCDNNPIMREDHGGERWSWKTFFAGVAGVTGTFKNGMSDMEKNIIMMASILIQDPKWKCYMIYGKDQGAQE